MNKKYGNSDIITLQEVSSALIDEGQKGPLGQKFWNAGPGDVDTVRDQNSVIMLNRKTFPKGILDEVTQKVYEAFPKDVPIPVMNGDINAVTAVDIHGNP